MDKILIDPNYCSREEYKELTDYLESNSWSFEHLDNDENDSSIIKSSLGLLIETAEDLVKQMPQKGNTSDKCQRVNLQEKLNKFQYAVNGIEDEDLKEEKEDK